jgi:hypothetical protein
MSFWDLNSDEDVLLGLEIGLFVCVDRPALRALSRTETERERGRERWRRRERRRAKDGVKGGCCGVAYEEES